MFRCNIADFTQLMFLLEINIKRYKPFGENPTISLSSQTFNSAITTENHDNFYTLF